MIKYATALRLGTADAETILKRFTRSHFQHPTYQALTELGQAVKTMFLCQYLHEDALRREIHDGLQVIENWKSTNAFIFYRRRVPTPSSSIGKAAKSPRIAWKIRS
jgi:TnpA family transposase